MHVSAFIQYFLIKKDLKISNLCISRFQKSRKIVVLALYRHCLKELENLRFSCALVVYRSMST